MKKQFDFAKAYQRLEELTKQFESGDLSLEEGLKRFEEGLGLGGRMPSISRRWRTRLSR